MTLRVSILVLSLALAGCSVQLADTGTGTGPDVGAFAGNCSRSPPLSWDNFGREFMDTHCVGCHSSLLPVRMRNGAPLGTNLDTYGDVLGLADRIEVRALGDEPTMPPGGGPDDLERARLSEWLACKVADDEAAMRMGRP